MFRWMDDDRVLRRLYVIGAVFLAVVAGIWTLVTASWTILSYVEAAHREADKAIIQRELDLYTVASKTVGDLATSPKGADWDTAKRRFLGLYWGDLGMVESPDVARAMVEFGKELARFEKRVSSPSADWENEQKSLQGYALNVAHAARDTLKMRSNIDFAQISGILKQQTP